MEGPEQSLSARGFEILQILFCLSPMNLNLDSQTAPGLRRHQVRKPDRPAANLFPERKQDERKAKGADA
jgi:hypothetical protein